jgi:hypothetical protein
MSKAINIRMPDDLVDWLENKIPDRGTTMSGVIINFLYELKNYDSQEIIDASMINDMIDRKLEQYDQILQDKISALVRNHLKTNHD